MKKASHPAKQQIESRQLDNKENDIDAVVEQIPFFKLSSTPISQKLTEQHHRDQIQYYYTVYLSKKH